MFKCTVTESCHSALTNKTQRHHLLQPGLVKSAASKDLPVNSK